MDLADRVAWASWEDTYNTPARWFLNVTPGAPVQDTEELGRFAINATSGAWTRVQVHNWPECYAANPLTGRYEWNNAVAAGTGSCYGTFAIFAGGRTVLAFNHWALGGTYDVGIGHPPSGSPDWTFAANSAVAGGGRLSWYVGGRNLCRDGVANQGETSVDCGGPCIPCPSCSNGVQEIPMACSTPACWAWEGGHDRHRPRGCRG